MAKSEKGADEGRRGFLKMAVSGAPAAAIVVASGREAVAETVEPQGTGLRKTAHVEAYLRSARF
jgi:hypothetical protein